MAEGHGHPLVYESYNVCLSVRPSVRPGPETHIPKKTHTFSFQVSTNEGPVCLGTWGKARRPGQGRGKGSLSDKQGQGPAKAGRVGQGRAGAGAVCLSV